MRYSRMRQLAEMSLPELRQVLINDLNMIPTSRVRRMLRGYLFCKYRIDGNVEHLQQLQSQARRITAAYKAVPGSGGYGSGRAEVITQIIQLQTRVKEDSARLQDEFTRVQFMIDSLDNFQERIVLQYKYINGWTFERIAMKMRYDVRHVKRLHKNALKKLVPLEQKMSLNVTIAPVVI